MWGDPPKREGTSSSSPGKKSMAEGDDLLFGLPSLAKLINLLLLIMVPLLTSEPEFPGFSH